MESYLFEPNRTVFRIESEDSQIIGIGEISKEKLVKLARVLIGEKSMRGKGIETELILTYQ